MNNRAESIGVVLYEVGLGEKALKLARKLSP